jgi:predicted nucleic acid-binding protein
MIVADTGAVVALVDRDDRWHEPIRTLFDADPGAWIIPWAALPEIDYLLGTHVGKSAQDAFLSDLAEGAFAVEWGRPEDLRRAHAVHSKHRALRLGLVDGVVIAVAERLRAKAIATLDLRHFGSVAVRGRPKLLPRDA